MICRQHKFNNIVNTSIDNNIVNIMKWFPECFCQNVNTWRAHVQYYCQYSGYWQYYWTCAVCYYPYVSMFFGSWWPLEIGNLKPFLCATYPTYLKNLLLLNLSPFQNKYYGAYFPNRGHKVVIRTWRLLARQVQVQACTVPITTPCSLLRKARHCEICLQPFSDLFGDS